MKAQNLTTDELFMYVIGEEKGRISELELSVMDLQHQRENYNDISKKYKVEIRENLERLYIKYFGGLHNENY